MLCGISGEGICLLDFESDQRALKALHNLAAQLQARIEEGDHPLTAMVADQLGSYFLRKRTAFDLPLNMVGTPFQVQVWTQLLDIPFGQTRTYAEQARLFGNVKAIRAIAAANAQNHLAILIPCHRVIGSDGSLRGYGGGIERKRYLLELERNDKGTLFGTV